MRGRVKNPENLRACSIVGCVKIAPKYPFFAKIPCFSLFLTLSFVCWAQVFHKPKVKGFLHRQEYRTSRGNPTGCFLPRNLVWILTITDTGLATAQKRYRIRIYRWHKIPPESEIVFKQDLF